MSTSIVRVKEGCRAHKPVLSVWLPMFFFPQARQAAPMDVVMLSRSQWKIKCTHFIFACLGVWQKWHYTQVTDYVLNLDKHILECIYINV